MDVAVMKKRGIDMGLEGKDLIGWLKQTEKEERQTTIELEKERLKLEKDLEKERLRLEKQNELEIRKLDNEKEIRLREMEVQRIEVVERPGTPLSESDIQSLASASPSAGPNAMHFPMPVYNPQNDSLDHYIHKFRKLAIAYSLDPTQWSLKLAQGLNQEAYEVYLQMAPGTENNFEELVKALLQRFELNAETYRKKFRNSKKTHSESYSQFSSRLHGYMLKWEELAEYEDTPEGIREMFLAEQLRESMARPMQTFLIENGATSLDSILKYADRYEMAHKNESQNKEAQLQKQKTPQSHTNNLKKYQPQKMNIKPGNRSDIQEGNKTYQKPYNSGAKKPYCKFCKNTSHYTNECKVKGATSYAACSAGGQKSTQRDTAYECKKAPVVEMVSVNDKFVETLYDTGLDFSSVISRELVEPDQFTGETLQIQSATRETETITVPIANVRVKSKYVTGVIPAAVMNQPLYPFILGARYVYLAEPPAPVVVGVVHTRSKSVKDPEIVSDANIKPDEIRVAQNQDDTLKGCFNKLPKAANPFKRGDFFMKGKLLYRMGGTKDQEIAQLVVPMPYRQQILDMGHKIMFSAHMGNSATFQRIAHHFYWPGMGGDIARYVRSCPECQKVAPKGRTAPVSLGETTIVTEPFSRVCVDLVGPLNRTRKRNAYILSLVDMSTMWVEAVALPTIDSVRIADSLINIFTRVGFPFSILSDNGSQFKGKLMKEVFEIFKTRHITTSPYHPQSNGLCERFNGTLVSMLKKLSQEKPEQWDEYLAAALFAYREVPHTSTGFSPAMLLFGRPIAGPLNLLKNTWTKDEQSENLQNTSQYVEELKKKLKVGWTLAASNLRKARKRHAKYYNRRTKDRQFEVGEKVLLLLPSGSSKLEIRWQGPFSIVEKVSRTNYKISIKGKHKVVHINLLRKYYERDEGTPVKLMALSIATEVEGGEKMSVEYPLHPQESVGDVDINPDLSKRQRERLREALWLTARPTKYKIAFSKLEFLGHTISEGCMTPELKNIEKLRRAPRPQTKKGVKSFVSLCGFYQKFIENFNIIAAPLTDTTRKGLPEKIQWTAECEEAYSTLKEKLTSKPILQLPDLEKLFVLRVDASNVGLGTTLLQKRDDTGSMLFPVAYASRKLSRAEQKYSTIERECLGLIWGIEKHQPYLYGRRFIVQSDHQPLTFLAASKNLNARLMRWSLLLQPYTFTVEFIPGRDNVGSDFLSRHPMDGSESGKEDPMNGSESGKEDPMDGNEGE